MHGHVPTKKILHAPTQFSGGAELDAGAALLRRRSSVRRLCGSGVATTLVWGREVDTHLGVDRILLPSVSNPICLGPMSPASNQL